ncbi:MAG: amino acid--tRNA ligase-related protein, partial [Chloroflexia bacterium]
VGAGTAPSTRAAHIARVKAALLRSAQNTLDAADFIQVVAPTLTSQSGACGEPGSLIPIQLGDKKAFLRQTAQLHLEPLMQELGAVYSVGRSFRAERKSDNRHLMEFTLIEAEAAGWSLEQLMQLMERMVAEMVARTVETSSGSLKALGADIDALATVQSPFKRMTYDQAIIALQNAGYFIEWGEDLTNEHEVELANMAGGPLFVTHYPVETRFFTMKVCRHDPRVVECCDLLMPGVGEVMGASETESNVRMLETRLLQSKSVSQIRDLGGMTHDYEWYVSMRRDFTGKQAGFGMGFERVVRYVCGLDSIAQAV